MSRLTALGRKFLSDRSGIATAEWVAVTSMFVIAGIIATYIVFGDDEEGMIALIEARKGQLGDRVDDVDSMITEVNAWSPSEQ